MAPKRKQQPPQAQPAAAAASSSKKLDFGSIPPAPEEHTDIVFAWLTTKLQQLPAHDQLTQATSMAITLARQLGVTGMSDAIVGLGGREIARAVSTVLLARVPAWNSLPARALDEQRTEVGTLLDFVAAAAHIAADAAFVVRPSPARPTFASDPPPRSQPAAPRPTAPIVEEVGDDEPDDEPSPPPARPRRQATATVPIADDDDGADQDQERPAKKPGAPRSATFSARAPSAVSATEVGRALTTIARRDETTLSSWRLRQSCDSDDDDDDEISAEQQDALRQLPRSKWPSKHADAQHVRRGWVAIADAFGEFHSKGAKQWLADLKSRLQHHRMTVTLEQAQLLASIAELGDLASGHTLAAALELSLRTIGSPTAPNSLSRIVPLLTKARLLWPTALDLGQRTAFPTSAGLSGLEVAAGASHGADAGAPPKTCRKCGKSGHMAKDCGKPATTPKVFQ
jgi:hypothetical protein